MTKLKPVHELSLSQCEAELSRILQQRGVEQTEGGEALSTEFRTRREQLARRLYAAGKLTPQQIQLFNKIGVDYTVTLDGDSLKTMEQMAKIVVKHNLMDPETIGAFCDKNGIYLSTVK